MFEMRVLAFQHYPTEPMGYIESILEREGIDYEYVKLYEQECPDFEELKKFSHLVFMGGPMGVYEEEKYPFLKKEKEIIRRAYREEIPVIGFCLGAQLIASALGKRVYPFKKELGWFEVVKTADDVVTENLPEKMTVFQWHGDTFDLPDDAVLLYRGHEVPNQAFRAGKCVALQFHLEVTEEIVRTWLKDEEMKEEDKRKIIEDTERYVKKANELCELLIKNFLSL